jgi:uncharacterized protein (TIGR02996 family)
MIATAGDALLADIIADPKDDGIRLIYADYLEDNGDEERAEFIRVQLEMARLHTCECAPSLYVMPGCATCQLVEPIRRRQRDLLDRHGIDWLAGLPGPLAFTSARMRRGLVAAVSLPLALWLEHGPALVKAHPLEGIELSDRRPEANVRGMWPDGVRVLDSWPRWGWCRRTLYLGEYVLRFALPDDVFACLPPPQLESSAGWWACGTEGEAIDALSGACLSWARAINYGGSR